MPLWLPFRIIRGHPRLFAGVATSLIVAVVLPATIWLSTRVLFAWNVGTWVYFIASGIMIARTSPQALRRRARASDEGRFFILLLTSGAALASIAAIVAQLAAVKDMTGMTKGLHMTLAGATIISAWFFIHLTYALHYAHEFFDEYFSEAGNSAVTRGGLIFPGTDSPNYYDFLYFSYVIGVASQTADVAITSHVMRRVAFVHCVMSFFFNAAILALTINIVAGLI